MNTLFNEKTMLYIDVGTIKDKLIFQLVVIGLETMKIVEEGKDKGKEKKNIWHALLF